MEMFNEGLKPFSSALINITESEDMGKFNKP